MRVQDGLLNGTATSNGKYNVKSLAKTIDMRKDGSDMVRSEFRASCDDQLMRDEAN